MLTWLELYLLLSWSLIVIILTVVTMMKCGVVRFENCPWRNVTPFAGNGHWTYPGYPKVSIIFYFSRFDLRFIIMADRWDRETFSERSVEDLKER